MTSSNGNIFRLTGHLCGEFTGPGEFPTQRPVTQSFDISLICVWINDWINNREAGDLRRYRAHSDVIVMSSTFTGFTSTTPHHTPVSVKWPRTRVGRLVQKARNMFTVLRNYYTRFINCIPELVRLKWLAWNYNNACWITELQQFDNY